mmetsp:Transcript_8353/g.12460  ORF Transcript_8353/g.12460 Transcript_8353/m.12460 type:complete len:126 (-) Transcript_8353:308-685(-)
MNGIHRLTALWGGSVVSDMRQVATSHGTDGEAQSKGGQRQSVRSHAIAALLHRVANVRKGQRKGAGEDAAERQQRDEDVHAMRMVHRQQREGAYGRTGAQHRHEQTHFAADDVAQLAKEGARDEG